LARIHEYKRLENSLVQKVTEGFGFLVKGVGFLFSTLGRTLTRCYTVVVVPHSEKKVYNLRISVLSVCCFFLVLTSLLGVLVWSGLTWNSAQGSLNAKDTRLKDTQANLDQLRDEIANLLREARLFEPALSRTLAVLNADVPGPVSGGLPQSGDLSTFFDIRETPEGMLQEVEDLKRISEYLAAVAKPVEEIGTLLNSQSALLTEIPSIWPIRGGLGHISMYFGQNENPFTGQYYIHKGIDISTYRQGDPILATADGQVVSVGYDNLGGFGNNIIIRHKHGFYTRYGHLLSAKVKMGQYVQQGDVIGYLGNTGLSTGPHLHYEVHIGSDVMDPYKYINIRSSIAKPAK